jgi:hypothetical protein
MTMRRTLCGIAGLLVSAVTLSAAPCVQSPTTLCLNASRFEAEVSWRDSRGRTGVGQAVSITADTGYFWFFSETNIELVVKVLDARSLNNKYWVFFGALSAVEYDLTVTDTQTGASKTYHNDLGSFASVGDTSAFDPIAPAPGHERMAVESSPGPPASLEAMQTFIDASLSKSTAAFTPCAERPYGFNLNDCRFHLSVNWRDSRGREGAGQPVQLTNDTGYFWFFSESNVELMVKVLDARPVNGHFWVFFGALSSVEFTLTVTDTLTGAKKTYRNPLSNFASVGDTAAFRGGHSVQPVPDEAASVSAEIGPEGGSLTAVGADGSRFTLDLPADALVGPTTITMTPVLRIDGMPFSGGLIAGVELEPQGLRLLVPGTLTLEAASPAALDRTLPYAYRGRGQSFMFYGRDADASALKLPIFHFSGYGAGSGHPSEATNHTEPAGPLDPYIQEIAGRLFQQILGLITRAQFSDYLYEISDRAYREVVKPTLEEARATCDFAEVKHAAILALEFLRFVQRWGVGDDLRLASLSAEVSGLMIEILTHCQLEALERCVRLNDPYEAGLMIFIARQLQLFGVDDPILTSFVEDGVIESCLRFELDFETKLVDVVEVGGYSYTKRYKFRSNHLPLRMEAYGNPFARSTAWSGGCTLVPELATLEFNRKPCTAVCTASNGYAVVSAMWIDGLADFDPANAKVYMFYDPGDPEVLAVEYCAGAPPSEPTSPGLEFSDQYFWAHRTEYAESYGFGYFAKGWQMLRTSTGPSQNGEFFAKKSYERTSAINALESITEETFLFLKHTPSAPMPSCP